MPCSLGGSLPDHDRAPAADKPITSRRSLKTKSKATKVPVPYQKIGTVVLTSFHASPSPLGSSPDQNNSTRPKSIELLTSSRCSSGPPKQELHSSNPRDDPFACFSKLFAHINLTESSHWHSDLELMHHYTAFSYRTLSQDPIVQEALQCDVPRLALSNTLLLHQILAFAGYHLAFLRPEHRHSYFMQASQHQNLAISCIQTTLAGEITSDNCHGLYAASILLTVSAFSVLPSYERYSNATDPVDSILDIFNLIKGMSIIRDTSNQDIQAGPLGRLFSRTTDHLANSEDFRFQALYGKMTELRTRVVESRELSNEIKDIIDNSITALSDCINKVFSRRTMGSAIEVRAAFLWPMLIPLEYAGLLRQRQPPALVLLSYYCIILHAAEPNCWVMNRWAETLIESFERSLYGSDWKRYLVWPLEVIYDS